MNSLLHCGWLDTGPDVPVVADEPCERKETHC